MKKYKVLKSCVGRFKDKSFSFTVNDIVSVADDLAKAVGVHLQPVESPKTITKKKKKK